MRTDPAAAPLDLRLVPGAAGTWGVCLLALHTRAALAVLAALTLAAGVLLAWPRRGGRRRSDWVGWVRLTLGLSCVIAVCAGGAGIAQIAHREGRVDQLAALRGQELDLELTLTSEPKASRAGIGARAMLHTVLDSAAQISLEPAVPVYATGVPDTARPGHTLVATGRVSPGDPVFVRLAATGEVRPPGAVGAVIDDLREGVRQASAHLPPQGRGLVPGVSIGDDRRLPPRLQEAMRTTSLTHLTAVSGAHVGIVTGTILILLARARWLRVALAAAALGAMVFLALPTPSVLRASTMGMIALIAMAVRRPRAGVPLLCASVTVLLAYDPWLATSIGFALSSAATLGLLTWSRPLAQLLGDGPLAHAAAIPIAAHAWCAPLLLVLDEGLATYALPANLLAVPALAPATILGLSSAVVSLLHPDLSALLATAAGWFTGWIAAVALFFAHLPLARLPWLKGPPGIAALVALTAGAAVAIHMRRRKAHVSRTWQA